MKKIVISAAFLLLSPQVANASIQYISATQARIGKPPILNVCHGDGFNLVLYQMEDSAPRVWLSDPSQVRLTFDTGKLSLDSPAGLLNLKRVDKVDFPGQQETQSTLLTIATQQKRVMRFKIAYNCPSAVDTAYMIADDEHLNEKFKAIRPQENIKDPIVTPTTGRVASTPPEIDITETIEVEAEPVPEPEKAEAELEVPVLDFSNLVVVDPNKYYFEPEETEEFEEGSPAPRHETAVALDPPSPETTVSPLLGEAILEVPDQTIEIPVPEPKTQLNTDLRSQDKSEVQELESLPVEVTEPSTKPVMASHSDHDDISATDILFYLRRGVAQGVVDGHMNYNDAHYRNLQSLIRNYSHLAANSEDPTLATAVEMTLGIDYKDAANVLLLGGHP